MDTKVAERRKALPNPSRSKMAIWLLAGIAVVLVFWAMQAAASILVPIVFGLLTMLMLAPLDVWLKARLPDWLGWLAHVAAMLVLLVILLMFVGALGFAAQQILAAMPDLSDTLEQAFAQGNDGLGAAEMPFLDGQLRQVLTSVGDTFSSWIIERATQIAQSSLSMTGAAFSALLFIVFIVLLALTEIDIWRSKLTSSVSEDRQVVWRNVLDAITSRLQQYLIVRTAVGVLQAALYAGWLAIFGVDLLFVWAVLTFILTYIPTIGSIISGTLPVLYALVVMDPGTALAIAAGIFVIEQVVGNYVDPKLLGRQVLLSPLVILISLLFWGWLWGAAGAFLATPISLTCLVVFNHLPALRPIALLVSNQPSQDKLDAAMGQ